MNAVVNLYSQKNNEIKKFLDKFYNKSLIINNDLKWEQFYENPVEIADIIGAYIDNSDNFNINMWVSLDKGVFINITDFNADKIIRYLFERYPY